MKTEKAIVLAGGGTNGRKVLAQLVGVTLLSTYRWKPDVPDRHVWKLMALKPDWFKAKK